jgi:cutinase
VLGLRGAGQSADKNHGAGQEILASARAMSADLHRESDTTVRLEGVLYRAEIAPTSAFHRANVEDGVRRTKTRIAELSRRCPDSRIALVGFSQGAQVVHELAAELPTATARRIALVAMIADPIRNPADSIASWTYGKAAPGPGKFGAGPALDPALQGQAITFCTARDEICNWPPGGYAGPLSDTHRHFYETSDHARSTGHHMADVLRSTLAD